MSCRPLSADMILSTSLEVSAGPDYRQDRVCVKDFIRLAAVHALVGQVQDILSRSSDRHSRVRYCRVPWTVASREPSSSSIGPTLPVRGVCQSLAVGTGIDHGLQGVPVDGEHLVPPAKALTKLRLQSNGCMHLGSTGDR